jgi:hypothetical protein
VSDLGRAAARTIDDGRDTAADGLESAASTLHARAEQLPGGERVSDLAHSAADRLSSTADYVRENDVKSVLADVEQVVKSHPGPALLAAAFVGFLVGRTLSPND